MSSCNSPIRNSNPQLLMHWINIEMNALLRGWTELLLLLLGDQKVKEDKERKQKEKEREKGRWEVEANWNSDQHTQRPGGMRCSLRENAREAKNSIISITTRLKLIPLFAHFYLSTTTTTQSHVFIYRTCFSWYTDTDNFTYWYCWFSRVLIF